MIFLLFLLIPAVTCSSLLDVRNDDLFISEMMQYAQRELAQSVLRANTIKNETDHFSVTPKLIFERLGFSNDSAYILPFNAYNKSFVLMGSQVFEVISDNIVVRSSVNLRDGVEHVNYVRSVEWRNIVFLLVSFKKGYSRLYTSSSEMNFVLRQTIHNFGQARDAHFFQLKDELHLALVTDKGDHSLVHSYIYRWTGTHLDVVHTFYTSGAHAVVTFTDGDDVIIVVAQKLPNNPLIGTQVLRLRSHSLERVHLLATRRPLILQPFMVRGEQYLLVINDNEPANTFWWSGKELYRWETLRDIRGKSEIAMSKSQELIYILQDKTVIIYQPNEMNFRAIQKLRVPHHETDEILKIALVDSAQDVLMFISQHSHTLHMHLLKIALVPASESSTFREADPFSDCLGKLSKILEERQKQIHQIQSMSDILLQINEPTNYSGTLLVTETLHATNISTNSIHITDAPDLFSTPSELVTMVTELDPKIEEVTSLMNDIVFDSGDSIDANIIIQGDLIIKDASAVNFQADMINGKYFEPEFWLTYNGNETIDSAVSVSTLVIHNLNSEFVNEKKIDDLLRTKGDQEITGEVIVPEILARDVHVSKGSFLLQGFLTLRAEQAKIKHIKTKDLIVEGTINGMDARSMGSNVRDATLMKNNDSFSDDVVTPELKVDTINGLQWSEFISNFFMEGFNQTIDGSLTFSSAKTTVKNLTVLMINNVLTENFLTKGTDQVVDADFKVDLVTAKDVSCEDVNHIHISTDVVQDGAENYIAGPVRIENIHVLGSLSMNPSSHVSGLYPPPSSQTHIYLGQVTINGTLKANDAEMEHAVINIGDTTFKLADLREKYWTTNTVQVIPGSVELEQPLHVSGSLKITSVNGVPIDELILTRDEIPYNLELDSLQVLGSVTGEAGVTVSGIDVERLEHEAVRGTVTVYGIKEFRGGLNVSDLHCDYLSGVDIQNDIPLLTNSELHLYGKKQFDKLIVHGDVISEGPVTVNKLNNIDLSHKLRSIANIDDKIALHDVEFENVQAENLRARFLNNVELGTAVSLNDNWNVSRLEIYGSVDFAEPLTVNTINDIHVNSYLPSVISKATGGEIHGALKIRGTAILDHLSTDFVDGVDLHYLSTNALSREKEQQISGYFTSDNVFTENLNAVSISGVDMHKLIYVTDISEEFINVNFTFHDTEFTHLKVEDANGCNLTKALHSMSKLKGHKKFDSIHVEGNLDWRHSAPEHGGLSYIFQKSMKLYENQEISGSMTFNGNVAAESVSTDHFINDVNLDMIVKDALIKSAQFQEVNGSKYFESKLSLGQGFVEGNAVLKVVNEVDVLELNETMIRGYDEDRLVRGHKHFANGFIAQEFFCDGKINDVVPSDIATFDTPLLPPTSFKQLEILEDLNVKTVNSINLKSLIKERVTLFGEQTIHGDIIFKGFLRLHGDTTVERLNDVLMSDVIYTHGEQTMMGLKTFITPMLVEGPLNVDFIDGLNVTDLFSRAIMSNKNHTITSNVVFMNDVTLSDVNVKHQVNGLNIEDLELWKGRELISNHENIDNYRTAIRNFIQSSIDHLPGMACEFLYLEDFKKLPIPVNGVRRSSWQSLGSGNLMINTITWYNNTCPLPATCHCYQQHVVRITADGAVITNTFEPGRREFYFVDEKYPMLAAKVATNTLSYNSKCRMSPEAAESSYLTWSIPSSEGIFNDIGGPPRFFIPGYLADAIGFKTNSTTTFMVLAIAYSPQSDTHNIESLIYRMRPRDVAPILVQKLPTRGARYMALLQPPKSRRGLRYVHLVLGNTFDSDLNQTGVNVDIYRFERKQNKFEFLRGYPTSGVAAVRGLVLPDGNRFVLIAQRNNAPLHILKYSLQQRNYLFFQEIALETPVLDIGVFYVGDDDAFFGAVTQVGMVHIFKYGYIEGFKLHSSHTRKGVQSFTPFSLSGQQFVFLGGKNESQVLKVVTQCP